MSRKNSQRKSTDKVEEGESAAAAAATVADAENGMEEASPVSKKDCGSEGSKEGKTATKKRAARAGDGDENPRPRKARAPARPYKSLPASVLEKRIKQCTKRYTDSSNKVSKWGERLRIYDNEKLFRDNEGVIEYKPLLRYTDGRVVQPAVDTEEKPSV